MSAETNENNLADLENRRLTWNRFLLCVQWSSLLILLSLVYPLMTISMDIHWLVALSSLFILGLTACSVMKMGTAFNMTLFGLAILAVMIQMLVYIFRALLPG